MLATHIETLRWSLRKNVPDIKTMLGQDCASFVASRRPPPLSGEVPVFTFHSVEPVSFERQVRFLASNGYHTLDGEELLAWMAGNRAVPPRSVLLTFDDGLATLWTVACPLLQKYGFHAMSFIIPGCIQPQAPDSPRYEEFARGRVSAEALLARERTPDSLCSWREIRDMHASGTLEFHPHTLHHHLVAVQPRLVDFMHPRLDRYVFGNITVPVYREHGRFRFDRDMPWGTPVYRAEPRMAGQPQFFDDERVRKACVAYVERMQGERFFEHRDWRRRLFAVHREAAATARGEFESGSELAEGLFEDLRDSRLAIQAQLQGAQADHLCYPWYMGSPIANAAAVRAGYRAAYWGLLADRPTNRVGDDPWHIVRLDGRYVCRLPGEGRSPLRVLLREKLSSSLPGFTQRFS